MSWTGVLRNLETSNLLNRGDQCTRYLLKLKRKCPQIFQVCITIAPGLYIRNTFVRDFHRGSGLIFKKFQENSGILACNKKIVLANEH